VRGVRQSGAQSCHEAPAEQSAMTSLSGLLTTTGASGRRVVSSTTASALPPLACGAAGFFAPTLFDMDGFSVAGSRDVIGAN